MDRKKVKELIDQVRKLTEWAVHGEGDYATSVGLEVEPLLEELEKELGLKPW